MFSIKTVCSVAVVVIAVILVGFAGTGSPPPSVRSSDVPDSVEFKRAWLLLDEAITATMAVACALIFIGVAMSQQRAEARAASAAATSSTDQRTGQ